MGKVVVILEVCLMQEIKNLFEKIFLPWKITIEDEELFIGNRKTIDISKEWQVKWVMGRNEKGTYLEYYAMSVNRKHLHGCIYENGREEKMEVIKEYIMYSPSIPGDREKSMKEFESYNRELIRSLQEKGLF